MTPEELKPIVDAYGGVQPFAKAIEASERSVYAWLDGTRTMLKPTAKLIRSLPKAKKIAQGAK